MTILDEILAEKVKEVAQLKHSYHPASRASVSAKRSLYDRFIQAETVSIIAEIKRASPSKGVINTAVNPPEQAQEYAENGAGAISILTDRPFFQGTMLDLEAVRGKVEVPILNKDFIIDEIQIDRAKDYGADVILLIAAALPKKRLDALYQYAKAKDLDVLLEVHNEEELKTAKSVGAEIIGINNRDLKTFEVDIGVTEHLASQIKNPETLIISESGFRHRADVERVRQHGVKGILVGETMMRSGNLAQTFSDLRVPQL
ncbi:indole-3-glycerol phosphate synthase TrpC [Sediminibacillus halophilus]|uniref:Indole-3-glycerol phosphate synthase n=1 Tax=Sediminibacillus halophilus TaxID=482461 RepID=A0A1G9TMC2_9BACI|nr:indole-3-glycerol phosphate synthase TrpC [Sediminibacillus halophilus]SDM48823.1 indole-3-glycerol phosphate synthase [Sediminibacillus halophilus]